MKKYICLLLLVMVAVASIASADEPITASGIMTAEELRQLFDTTALSGTSTAPLSCVTKQEVLDAISVLECKEYSGVTNTVCDPCSCIPGYGSSACLQYLADKAKTEEESKANARDVISRFEEVGLCK